MKPTSCVRNTSCQHRQCLSYNIITGSNGAGKSTVGPDYLPSHIQRKTVFDGDKLFMEKRSELWRSGIKSHKECKKLAFEFTTNTFDMLVEKTLAIHSDFAYEGHFTNEATWEIPKRFKTAGYAIHLLFLGFPIPVFLNCELYPVRRKVDTMQTHLRYQTTFMATLKNRTSTL